MRACSAPARSRCACPRRSRGSPPCPSPGRSGASSAASRAAIVCAALVAVNPLFVWYSQEARVYGLFVLTGALAMLCFLRALREPTPRRMAAFAVSASLALLTHYFAVFLLVPMALWLAWERRTRRAALPAIGALGARRACADAADLRPGWPRDAVDRPLGALRTAAGDPAVLPHRLHRLLARAWHRAARRAADPRRRGARAVAHDGAFSGRQARRLAAARRRVRDAHGAARGRGRGDRGRAMPPSRGLTIALTVAACGVMIPIVLVAFGADYLAPRNLVAAMIPVTALIAVLVAWPAGGPGTGGLGAHRGRERDRRLSGDLDRRRAEPAAAARRLARSGRGAPRGAPRERVITTVELGRRRWSTTCRGCAAALGAVTCARGRSTRPATSRSWRAPASPPRRASTC